MFATRARRKIFVSLFVILFVVFANWFSHYIGRPDWGFAITELAIIYALLVYVVIPILFKFIDWVEDGYW